MYVYKDFGNSIRKDGKTVIVSARIAEINEDDVEILRNDLTKLIQVFSQDGTLAVKDGGVNGKYKNALVTAEKDSALREGTVSFQYAGEGGVFTKSVVFRLVGEIQIVFPDMRQQKIGIQAFFADHTTVTNEFFINVWPDGISVPMEDQKNGKIELDTLPDSNMVGTANIPPAMFIVNVCYTDHGEQIIEKNPPIEPVEDNNWSITGVDLSVEDLRRSEIIGYINEGYLESPVYESYNLADYDELISRDKANKAAGIVVESTQ